MGHRLAALALVLAGPAVASAAPDPEAPLAPGWDFRRAAYEAHAVGAEHLCDVVGEARGQGHVEVTCYAESVSSPVVVEGRRELHVTTGDQLALRVVAAGAPDKPARATLVRRTGHHALQPLSRCLCDRDRERERTEETEARRDTLLAAAVPVGSLVCDVRGGDLRFPVPAAVGGGYTLSVWCANVKGGAVEVTFPDLEEALLARAGAVVELRITVAPARAGQFRDWRFLPDHPPAW